MIKGMYPDTSNWSDDETTRLHTLLSGRTTVCHRGSVFGRGGKHQHLYAWAKEAGLVVDCVRRGGRATKWANPFPMAGEGDRDRVCDAFSDYVNSQPDIIAETPSLKGKLLACYCSPLRCHCDVLAELANSHPAIAQNCP